MFREIKLMQVLKAVSSVAIFLYATFVLQTASGFAQNFVPEDLQFISVESPNTIPTSEIFFENIAAEEEYAKEQFGDKYEAYMVCRFIEEEEREGCKEKMLDTLLLREDISPGELRLSTIALREEAEAISSFGFQRETPNAELNRRRVRRHILKYLGCRFGPRGESRAVCARETIS